MERQLVIFSLGKEQFGIDIAVVEGIVRTQVITKLPYSHDFMEGITELRGAIIPVMDLNKRFGLPPQEQTDETRIIAIRMEQVKMGMTVSAVTEVLTIDEKVIEPLPPIMSKISSEFIAGVAKMDPNLIILLNLEQVLNIQNMDL
jgi:purine-binding chemotaxis protein CheW